MLVSLLRYKLCSNCNKALKIFSSLEYIETFRHKKFNKNYSTKRNYNPIIDISESNKEVHSKSFSDVIEYFKDSRILYNCFSHAHRLPVPNYLRNSYKRKILNKRKTEIYKNSIPLVVESLYNLKNESNINDSLESKSENLKKEAFSSQQFPFSKFENFNENDVLKIEHFDENSVDLEASSPSIKKDIEVRLKTYNEKIISSKVSQVAKKNEDEELGFKIYGDTLLSDLSGNNEVKIDEPYYYGTPKPDIPKSNVPCGGCGVILHCQDDGLPGYVPSEEFCGKKKTELKSILCQRCFFLTEYKMALNVRVSPEIYEKALKPIVASKSLILVIVDLLDVPCSVWPGLFKLIGSRRPVIVVGNKVDLIPLDNPEYLSTIKESLIDSIRGTNLWKANIKDICLVSAKTGYGIESLISHIQVNWGVEGDIYIVGCTNAGKSSLFNALLGSDMCKVAAINLIRRATSSPWPGTTLNLLKFPVMRPTGKRLFDRKRRIEEEKKKTKVEKLNKFTSQSKKVKASLTGHIGQTFQAPIIEKDYIDPFNINANKIPMDSLPGFGIDEKSIHFADSKWCYDTPGTVQPDQFLGLLTHDELIDVLPRELIEPRTFSLRSSQTLFIGGLTRIDALFCDPYVRMTVCSSSALPITIVPTSEASSVYRTYLGTELMKVPRGNSDRLEKWPVLKPHNIWIKGKGERSAADVVLSSAGFITICGKMDSEIDLRAWTPGGRGVFVRAISMLPHVENLRGKKQRGTLKYNSRLPTFDDDDGDE